MAPQGHRASPGFGTPGRDEHLRIGDRERDEAVELLQEHVADGRLTLSEFDERAAQAYASKTRGDLARLTADLPPLRRAAPAAPAPAAAKPMTAGTIARVLVPALLLLSLVGLVAGAGVPPLAPIIVGFVVLKLALRPRHGCRF
ncbi:DUF1707 SHOCT-like domain-containing protein [Prauserella muralis]|uniref:DUF1707 domain-containing protein n=1 Tax=Prauserella muralis TaxID=588067 RepID=A0A2V4ALS7_9PSEU|nr:DUF1707 domain-containing protein [Prauserella muralis]PXY19733.1 hypothetical protein BAY60_32150 [Prauserella muralis]TWE29370.1 uncharacterized protein DUF1707 [Prauserella muralis]